VARRLFPSGDIAGTRIRFGVQPDLQNLEVVGVAGIARINNLREANIPVIYVPSLQYTRFPMPGNLFVRAKNPAELANPVAKEVQSYGREYATGTQTIEETTDQSLVPERATTMLSAFYAAVALALAAFGLFGLMSHTVTRRTREIGIRLALGSQSGRIMRNILREAFLITLIGIFIGLPCALFAAHIARHMIFGLSSHDPLTLILVSITLLAVSGIAGYWPARRAISVDPVVALRSE
jgi:ABC-type antimicrobial peptide transport system permease subunit